MKADRERRGLVGRERAREVRTVDRERRADRRLVEIERPTPNAPFSIDSPNFPTSLDPNESATFSIGFHPTSLGAFSQTLQITSPQLKDPLVVSLFGTSVSTTPPPDAGVGPSPPSSTTFYACNAGGSASWPLAIAVLVIFRRRRGPS